MGTEVLCNDVKVGQHLPEHGESLLTAHVECDGALVQVDRVVHPVGIQWTLFRIRVSDCRGDG